MLEILGKPFLFYRETCLRQVHKFMFMTAQEDFVNSWYIFKN